ncbi:superoxide dismutase [Chryseobacterium sp. R2ACT005]|uniref:superoxide dismutase n=1 Tax=Chryseobacterium sp. R2ACT005 TaxID=3416668 RepID=UPI003CFA79BA
MKYTLQPLPYEISALEPVIDTKTMDIHFNRHHKTYVDNLNKALDEMEIENLSLEELFINISKHPVAVRNNAGGHYNHAMFWKSLSPVATELSESLSKAINNQFGSLENLKKEVNEAGLKRFGSGWVWLIIKDGALQIISTPNQDNPLMDTAEIKGVPILGIDVWEHAYYLKHENKRVDYLENIWKIINWKEVSWRYQTELNKI